MLYITINRRLATALPAAAILALLLLWGVSLAHGSPYRMAEPARQLEARIAPGDVRTDPVMQSQGIDPVTQVTASPATAQTPASGRRISLPALDTTDCETWIQVQNVGDDLTKAILVIWSDPGSCEPQAAGPIKAECSGLIPPGGAWTWVGSLLPSGAKSGIVYSLGARRTERDIAADIICEYMSETVLGDDDDWLVFDSTYRRGGNITWSERVVTFPDDWGQPLVVTVNRNCPGDNDPELNVNAGYPGLPEAMQGVYDPVFGDYAYYAWPVWASYGTAPDDTNSIIHIQNLGDECTSIELWFQPEDNCLQATTGEVAALAPGESFPFDPNTVVGPDFQGNAWIRAPEPLGVVVDQVGQDLFMSHTGMPADVVVGQNTLFTAGAPVNYAPLFFRESQGWDIGVHVQNLSYAINAKVKVIFLDAIGQTISSVTEWACPRGLHTFSLPAADVQPGYEVGVIRIESQEWWSPGEVPNITSAVTLIKYDGLGQPLEALSYNALPVQQVEGTQVIALPMVVQNKMGVTSEIALANLSTDAGVTDVRITLYDQVGMLNSFTRQLRSGQVEYLDVNVLRHVNPGFLGSAVISVVGSPQGSVALAAAGVQRPERVLTDPDIPGDEALAVAGRPLSAPFAPYPLEQCSAVDRPIPDSSIGLRVGLPALDTEDCETWIQVQNVGDVVTQAILIVWGDPGSCEPQAAGPWWAECSDLIPPGGAWTWKGTDLPSGAVSGVVYSLGAQEINGSETFADLVCQVFNDTGVGDDDDWRRFDLAHTEGRVWRTVQFPPLDFGANAGQPLAVTVNRICPGDETPSVNVNAAYRGVTGVMEGTCNVSSAGYTYHAPLVWAGFGAWNSIIHTQNLGDECTSVEIWFQAQDNCLRTTIGEILALAPGEGWQFDPNWVVGPDWQGNLWIRASEPLGVVVDQIGQDMFMSYNGMPADVTPTRFTAASAVNYAPLLFQYRYGWDTGLQVQNLSLDANALVRVTFSDDEGRIISTIMDWICPRGSQTFFLPAIGHLPGDFVGVARIESEAWQSPGNADVHQPNILTLVNVIKYSDETRSQVLEALSYNTLPAREVEEVSLIALPFAAKGGDGVTTEIALSNLNPAVGTTDVRIDLYDQIGLVATLNRSLNSGQLEYIDLDAEAGVGAGLVGSAMISATGGTQGGFALAAVAVEHVGRTLSDPDIPGDEVKAYEGRALGPHYCILQANVDGDKDVDVEDIMAIVGRWRGTFSATFDLDGDGDVDVADVMGAAARWGDRCIAE